jgi:hypothetical protein
LKPGLTRRRRCPLAKPANPPAAIAALDRPPVTVLIDCGYILIVNVVPQHRNPAYKFEPLTEAATGGGVRHDSARHCIPYR